MSKYIWFLYLLFFISLILILILFFYKRQIVGLSEENVIFFIKLLSYLTIFTLFIILNFNLGMITLFMKINNDSDVQTNVNFCIIPYSNSKVIVNR